MGAWQNTSRLTPPPTPNDSDDWARWDALSVDRHTGPSCNQRWLTSRMVVDGPGTRIQFPFAPGTIVEYPLGIFRQCR